ncbi:MAG: 3D domain-containing protein [Candidatus Spechtbacterales bacterium]
MSDTDESSLSATTQAGKRFPDIRGEHRRVIIHTIRPTNFIRHFRMLFKGLNIEIRVPVKFKKGFAVIAALFVVSVFSAHYSLAEEGFSVFQVRASQPQEQELNDESAEDVNNEKEDNRDTEVQIEKENNAEDAGKSVTQTFNVPITAYSSTPDQTWGNPFITASGTRVRDGIIAANFLPLGTKVRIPEYYGDKVFVVEDRMNSRYWHRADIWMETRHEALQWGIRYTTIEVIN